MRRRYCRGAHNTFLLSGPDGKLHDATGTLPETARTSITCHRWLIQWRWRHADVVLTRLSGEAPGAEGLSFLLGDGKGGFSSSTADFRRISDRAYPNPRERCREPSRRAIWTAMDAQI